MWRAFYLLTVLNAFDAGATALEIHHNGLDAEANPLALGGVVAYGPYLALAIKCALPLLLAVLLRRAGDSRPVRAVLWLAVAPYAFVAVLHSIILRGIV